MTENRNGAPSGKKYGLTVAKLSFALLLIVGVSTFVLSKTVLAATMDVIGAPFAVSDASTSALYIGVRSDSGGSVNYGNLRNMAKNVGTVNWPQRVNGCADPLSGIPIAPANDGYKASPLLPYTNELKTSAIDPWDVGLGGEQRNVAGNCSSDSLGASLTSDQQFGVSALRDGGTSVVPDWLKYVYVAGAWDATAQMTKAMQTLNTKGGFSVSPDSYGSWAYRDYLGAAMKPAALVPSDPSDSNLPDGSCKSGLRDSANLPADALRSKYAAYGINLTPIWGQRCIDTGDNLDSLYSQAGYTAAQRTKIRSIYPSGFGLYTQGMTLFRKEFNLTVEDINDIKAMEALGGGLFLDVVADDWHTVYFNEKLISHTVNTANIAKDVRIPSEILVVGKNVVAMEVIDLSAVVSGNLGNPNSGITRQGAALAYALVKKLPHGTPFPPIVTPACASVVNISGVSPITFQAAVRVPNSFNISSLWVKQGATVLNFTGSEDPDGAYAKKLMAQVVYVQPVSGTYTITWGVTSLGLTCNGTVNVGDQPYFQVYGGDIIAGISLGGVPLSIPPTTADIISWNQDTGSYAGAGSQLAAIATGNIKSFVTAQGSAGPSQPIRPIGLSFANIAPPATVGTPGNYGGKFASLPASDKYYDAADALSHTDVPSPSPTINLGALDSGVYHHTGSITIDAFGSDVTIAANKSITIYTDGDVYINDNILYGYNNLGEIPRLNIYTTGNIIVDNDVQKLHGVFVAEGSGSTFYSCGTAPASFIGYSSVGSGSNYTICNKQLTIYGSVVAQKLVLARTYGSLGSLGASPDEPAEVFKHSPETWLGGRSGAGGGAVGGGTNSFDYYISLPPVL